MIGVERVRTFFSVTGLTAITSWSRRSLNRLTLHPWYTRAIARYFYPLLTRMSRKDDVLFLNFGYEEDPPMGIELSDADEPNRYLIQLYHRTACQAELSDKHILEVSCGHGGGASYLFRTFHPASYTAMDLNSPGIEFCSRRFSDPGLSFVQGDAQCLPFDDERFDIVINVEASHCYANFSGFLAEVARVLRPGGHFLYTDLRRREEMSKWEQALDTAPMLQLSRTEINEQVKLGLQLNWPRLRSKLEERLPSIEFLRKMAASVVGGPGSVSYNNLESGNYSYQMCCFIKR